MTKDCFSSRLGIVVTLYMLIFLVAGCSTPAEESTVPVPTGTPRSGQDERGDSEANTLDDQTSVPVTTTISSAVTAAPPSVPTPVPTTAATTASGESVIDESSISNVSASLISLSDLGPGSLLQLTMSSSVGVLLDEYPDEMKDRVADELIAQDGSIWYTRAVKQVELTYNRLHFRNFAYDKQGVPGKGQLPLPPREKWVIELDAAGPYRAEIEGHELILIDYSFTSVLVSDEASPGLAEPELADVGGTWEEPFVFPADPTQILQRTGNACLNEGGFPPNSYDSENVADFFDYSCQADDGGVVACHRTTLPTLSCQQALAVTIGRINTVMQFERLEWDDDLAAANRVGPVTTLDAPDLAVITSDLANNRISYRYFPADSCALQEACVGASGWRRLLQFDATVHNVGGLPLHIGPVLEENPETNLFEYDACHNHIHYSNYGDFLLGADSKPNKRAFCVESTSRFSNNEAAPLIHPYSCGLQGIQAGWVDEYGAGLDCQWIDITDEVQPTETSSLTIPLIFRSNTNEFLCEGTPVLDENGEQVWRWSGLTNDQGLPIAYPACDLIDDWDVNNRGEQELVIPPTGSFVTEPCLSGETGPKRNCDFSPVEDSLACVPGQLVQMSCQLSEEGAPQVMRVCETSATLGIGIPCTFSQSLTNAVIGTALSSVEFVCPAARSGDEPGGEYAFYAASVFSGDSATAIQCQPNG